MADPQSRAGGRYASEEIFAFVDATHAGHDAALGRAFSSPAMHGMPEIMLAPSEGRLVELLIALVGAAKVIEIGTLAGYSAVRMGRALAAGGRLWSIEADARYADVARANIAAAGLSDRVEVVVGAARDVLPELERLAPFDAVFVDADKASYPHYGAWAADHLRPGGLLLADNAFLFGELLDPSSETAAAMRRFHRQVAARFDSVCIPTPDGLVLGIKR